VAVVLLFAAGLLTIWAISGGPRAAGGRAVAGGPSEAAGWEWSEELPTTGLGISTINVPSPFLYAHIAVDEDSYQVRALLGASLHGE